MPRTRIITRSKTYSPVDQKVEQGTPQSHYSFGQRGKQYSNNINKNCGENFRNSDDYIDGLCRSSKYPVTKENEHCGIEKSKEILSKVSSDSVRNIDDSANLNKSKHLRPRRRRKSKQESDHSTYAPILVDIDNPTAQDDNEDEKQHTDTQTARREITSAQNQFNDKRRHDFGLAKQIISNILNSQVNHISKPLNVSNQSCSKECSSFTPLGRDIDLVTENVGFALNSEHPNHRMGAKITGNGKNTIVRHTENDDDTVFTTNENDIITELSPEAVVTTSKRKRRRPRRRSKRQQSDTLSELSPGDEEDHNHQQCYNPGITSEAGDSGFDVSSQCSSVSCSSVKGSNGDSPSRSSSGSRSSSSLLLSGLDPENLPFYFKEPDIEIYRNPFVEEDDGETILECRNNDTFDNDDDDADSIFSWSEIENFDDYGNDSFKDYLKNNEREDGVRYTEREDCVRYTEESHRETGVAFVEEININKNETKLNIDDNSADSTVTDVVKERFALLNPKEDTVSTDDLDQIEIQSKVHGDFTADHITGTEGTLEEKEEEDEEDSDPSVEIDYDSFLPANILMHVKRDLVSILMEYGQTREVQVSFEDMDRTGPHHASRFFTSAVVDGETFPVGCGSSKKNAKKAAAAYALNIMYERGKQNLKMVNESAFRKIGALNPKDPESRAHKVLLASRHALEVCQETQFINYSKEKIVATFVLELHGKMKVVALGTGNRCILYPNLTKDGKKVIHAHAEIIARRAFIRYLYKQLLLFSRDRSHPIFTKSESGKLKLRDKIQIHLYISRPPCGDAAAFPTIGNHPNKMRAVRKQGQLRTIIDDGEGAIPTEFHVPPGPNGKERLRIMTCSDKICRWNALGVQGALLTHFIDPIYITTLVIGSHTGDQRGHLPRAISGRIKCGRLHEVIQRPYRINSPEIQYPHDDMCDIYAINKSKQYFITWSYGDEDTEVIDAITGVTNMEPMDEPRISRICKRTLHELFFELCAKFGRTDLMSMSYSTAKRCATTFQRMKSFVGQHMAVMGFGHWYSLQETYGTDNFTNDCPTSC